MSQKSKILGFTAVREKVASKKAEQEAGEKKTALIRFDSWKMITYDDAKHHTLVLGTTGSGKTVSVVLPALKRMIENGFPGFLVDIKGNLTAYVRAMAKRCGREDDIIELGTELTATPINRLQGMNTVQVYTFLESLIAHLSPDGDPNRHFPARGNSYATDCFKLLSIMAIKDQRFTPTIKLIADLLSDHVAATQFFNEFVQHKEYFVSNDYSLEMIDAFIKRVQRDALHLLCSPAVNKGASTYTTYSEQLSYSTKTLNTTLYEMLMTPGFVRNFCHISKGQEPFKIEDVFLKNKIVLLRFSPVSGRAGEILSRHMAKQFYKAVYMHGLKMPKGKFAFACYDEFQSFADLSGDRYSDGGFVEKAREFNTIFIAATQSMSALARSCSSMLDVDQFVSNCNCRIVFYSDDPYTQKMVGRYNEGVRLNELKDKVFVIQYDASLRQHKHRLDGLQDSYASTKGIVEQNQTLDEINMDASITISSIPALTESICQVKFLSTCQDDESGSNTMCKNSLSAPLPFIEHIGESVVRQATFYNSKIQ